MNKEIKIGKYIITFGIKKELPKGKALDIPTIAADELKKEDEYLNSTQHYTFRDKIGRTISRVDRTPIKTKIVNEIVFTEEDVFKKMEAMAGDIKYTSEDRVDKTIPPAIYEELLLGRRR